MLNTLRSVIDDDAKWFADIHDFYQHFKYQQIMTEDVVAWWNQRTGMNLTPFFDEYLRHAAIPVLELEVDKTAGMVSYKWKADEAGFAMPIRIGTPGNWTAVTPLTTKWRTRPFRDEWKDDESVVADGDFYYVNVQKQNGAHEFGEMDRSAAGTKK